VNQEITIAHRINIKAFHAAERIGTVPIPGQNSGSRAGVQLRGKYAPVWRAVTSYTSVELIFRNDHRLFGIKHEDRFSVSRRAGNQRRSTRVVARGRRRVFLFEPTSGPKNFIQSGDLLGVVFGDCERRCESGCDLIAATTTSQIGCSRGIKQQGERPGPTARG
jgi:hypothetical protein